MEKSSRRYIYIFKYLYFCYFDSKNKYVCGKTTKFTCGGKQIKCVDNVEIKALYKKKHTIN